MFRVMLISSVDEILVKELEFLHSILNENFLNCRMAMDFCLKKPRHFTSNNISPHVNFSLVKPTAGVVIRGEQDIPTESGTAHNGPNWFPKVKPMFKQSDFWFKGGTRPPSDVCFFFPSQF